MSASSHPAVWRSGIPIPFTLTDMTVVGPTGMGIPEHEHPEIQISMTFDAQSPRGKTKSIRDFPGHFSLHPSGMPHGRNSDGAESLATVFSQAYIEQAADELLRRSSSEIVSTPCAFDPVILAMGKVLREELLQGPIRDPLLVEAVGVVLTGQLVRHWSSQPKSQACKGPAIGRPDSQHSGCHRELYVLRHSRPRPRKPHWRRNSPVHSAVPANDGLQSLSLRHAAAGREGAFSA